MKLSRTGNLESLDPSKFNQAMDDFLVEFQGSSFLNSIPESKLTECKSRIKTLYQTFEKRFKAIEDPDGKIDKAKLGSISLIAKSFSAKAEESLLQPMKNNEIKKPVNVWVLLKDFFISVVSSIRKNEVKPLPEALISLESPRTVKTLSYDLSGSELTVKSSLQLEREKKARITSLISRRELGNETIKNNEAKVSPEALPPLATAFYEQSVAHSPPVKSRLQLEREKKQKLLFQIPGNNLKIRI